MAYSRYAIHGRRPMTAETTIVVLGMLGLLVACGAQAIDISPWRLFGVGCLPGALVVGLAVFFLIALGSSLVLYAGTAVGGVIDGIRSGGGSGANVVLCPIVGFGCGAVVLYAAFAAAFHCFEF
jgi:hypothetical protein